MRAFSKGYPIFLIRIKQTDFYSAGLCDSLQQTNMTIFVPVCLLLRWFNMKRNDPTSIVNCFFQHSLITQSLNIHSTLTGREASEDSALYKSCRHRVRAECDRVGGVCSIPRPCDQNLTAALQKAQNLQQITKYFLFRIMLTNNKH